MPSDPSPLRRLWRAYPMRIGFFALAWLVLIAGLHLYYNTEHEHRPVVKMGYMPVITNLAAPLLDSVSAGHPTSIRFKAIKFASFAEMAEALRNGEIQAAFIIAPLSIVLHQQGEDVRVVYIGNRHESTMVVRKSLAVSSITDLVGRTVAVPMRFSGHNLAMLKMTAEAGLEGQIRVVEMNPPDMASAMAAGSLDAYFVGEPFAAQTLKDGVSKLLFRVEDVWPGFICNLLLVKQNYIDRHPDRVRTLVEGAARSGLWARSHLSQAAKVASTYWGQPVDLVTYALSTPPDRIVYDRFVPVASELQELARLMVDYGLADDDDIAGLVADRFARQADLDDIGEMASILIKP